MPNFAVKADEETIRQGNELLEEIKDSHSDIGTNGDALKYLFALIKEQKNDQVLLENGVDVQALDASISNIRHAFLAAVSGKAELMAQKDAEIAQIKELKDSQEKDLRKQIIEAKTARKEAESTSADAAKTAEQAIKDAAYAKEQAETQKELLAEKERTISTLSSQLSSFKEKADAYDSLKAENEKLKHQLSDQKKDADLEKERAVGALRVEIASLKAKADLLQERISELTS